MQLTDATDLNSAAYDANSLAKLHAAAAQSSPQALKAVAKQMEGMFVQMMLKSMRAAVPQGGLLDSSQTDLYTSLYDQQMSQQVTSKGLGLADMMYKQLSRTSILPDPAAAQDVDKPAPMDMSILHGQDAINAPYAAAHLQWDSSRHDGHASSQGQDSGGESADSRSFTDKLTIPAMLASQQSGISHHLIMAQAALESDWGRREIPATNGIKSHNLFGIKATDDWQGKTTSVMTTEYQSGQAVKVMQRFRVYDSYQDAIKDYIHVLTDNPRYHEVVNATQPEAAAYALQRAGYATDPNYGAKLVQIIGQLKNAASHAVSAYTRDLGGLF